MMTQPEKSGWYRCTIEDSRQEGNYGLREATCMWDGKSWGGLLSGERVTGWREVAI